MALTNPNILLSTTFSGINISAGTIPICTYTHTAPAVNCWVIIEFWATVAGSGDYTAWITKQWAGAGTVHDVTPHTTITLGATTDLSPVSIIINLFTGDVLKVYLKGLPTDVNISGGIRIAALNLSIFEAIDLAGGDGDTLETLSDQLDIAQTDLDTPNQYKADVSGLPTAIQVDTLLSTNHGAGLWGTATVASKECNYPVTNNDTGLPVSGAVVEVSTDIARANVIRKEVTNSLGIATFYLEPGDYYFWTYHDDYTFTNPDLETIPA